MSDLLSWFVVELRSRLEPFLPSKQVETVVTEARSHLTESIEKLKSDMSLGDEQATATAIDAFGSPEKVASSHLRENAWRPMGIRPIWLVLGSASTAVWCWILNFIWLHGYFDNFGATWENGLAGIVGVLALVVFGIGCYAGRRRYRREIFVVGAATCLAIYFGFSFIIVGSNFEQQGISRLHFSRDLAAVKGNVAALTKLDDYVQRGAGLFAHAKSPSDLPREFSDRNLASTQMDLHDPMAMAAMEGHVEPKELSQGNPWYVVPNKAVFAMVDRRIWAIDTEHDFSHAVARWQQNAADNRKSIAFQIGQMNLLLTAASQAQAGRIFFFNPKVYEDPLGWAIICLPALFLVEAFAHALFKRRRRYPVNAPIKA